MSNLDLDAIKAALGHDVFHASGGLWKARHFSLMWKEDASEAIVAILNAAPALIAEVERLRRELATELADSEMQEMRIANLEAETIQLRQELATAKKIGAAEELERKIAQIRADLNDMNPDAYKRRGKVEPGYCEALNDIAQGLECRAAELRAEVGG